MMASELIEPGEANTEEENQAQEAHNDISKNGSVQRTLALLSASGDTSRFAGLTVLKALLDSNEELQKDDKIMTDFWAAIPSRFLDRLLKAGASGKKSKQESESMAELAVGVLHAFLRIIPVAMQEDEKFIGRAGRLMAALVWSPEQSITQILQILVTLASTPKGCLALLKAGSWHELLRIVPKNPLAMDVVGYTFLKAVSQTLEQLLFWEKLDSTLFTLAISFADTKDPIQLFEYLNQILTVSSTRDTLEPPAWLVPVIKLIQGAALSRQAASISRTRQAMVLLTATLCHLYPSRVSRLIFGVPELEPRTKSDIEPSPIGPPEPKISYLFVKLLLIDIRSTTPSLLTLLNSPEYPSTSARIRGSYDIVSCFIGFLVQSVDNEEIFGDPVEFSIPCSISPSLLLQLREDISDVMSLTIGSLRKRFDTSVFEEGGRDMSLRPHSAGPSHLPFVAAWESSDGGMSDDPLTLSQIRTLALWLRDEDNDSLCREATEIMDILFYLYPSTRSFDFRSPVLIALEGIIAVPEGVEAFNRCDGWNTFYEALRILLISPNRDPHIGVGIVRVLLGILEATEPGSANEAWWEVVRMTAVTTPTTLHVSYTFEVVVGQLAVQIIERSPLDIRRRNCSAMIDLKNWAVLVGRCRVPVTREEKSGLQDIIQALEGLIMTCW